MKYKKIYKGFTLIELLIVIGILAILLAITLIAINPARQFMQANNTKRRNDVKAIFDAVSQYQIDNKGVLPSQITITPRNISKDLIDLCSILIPTYIAELPADPNSTEGNSVSPNECSNIYDTDYTIVKSPLSNHFYVAAPESQLNETISIPTSNTFVNYLNADTADIETGSGNWYAWFSSTINRSTEYAHSGIASLRINITALYGWGISLTNWPGFTTSPGDKTFGFWAKLGFGNNIGATMTVEWIDSNRNIIASNSATINTLTNTWQLKTANVVAPAGTSTVNVHITHPSGDVGDYVFVDDIFVVSSGN